MGKWKTKARIQNLIAKLPSNLSYATYYFIQRRFGGLRNLNPTKRLLAGIAILDYIRAQGQTIESKTFLEIGTGRRLNLPIALWLGGAARVITVDLNPYLNAALVAKDISYIKNNQQEIKQLFAAYSQKPIFLERFNQLIKTETKLTRWLEMMNIQYLAPADASHLDLPPQSIDHHISYTVLEHIPPRILDGILREAKRLLRKKGLLIHNVDFSDHFSHSDESISAINFLRFRENEWEHYAGNRYMYHNRLRIDDFAELCDKTGLRILAVDAKIDQRALKELRTGFPLNEKFKHKDEKTNATTSAWIIASLGEPT